MWFKNILAYRLLTPFEYTAEELQGLLIDQPSRPCGQLERLTLGWTAPLGVGHESLAHEAAGAVMIALRKEERLLPQSVVREQLQHKILAIENEQGRKISARDKRALQEELTLQLLPKAFTRADITYGYFDKQSQHLILDLSRASKAEEFIILLQKTLPNLRLEAITVENSIARTLTQWVIEGRLPEEFEFNDFCELRDPRMAKNVIKCLNQAVDSEEITQHLLAGKEVFRLKMLWRDRLNFILEDDLSIKRLQFTDLIQEEARETSSETSVDQFDAEFVLCRGEIAAFLPSLLKALGTSSDETVKKAEKALA